MLQTLVKTAAKRERTGRIYSLTTTGAGVADLCPSISFNHPVIVLFTVLLGGLVASRCYAELPPPVDRSVDFNVDVLPVLEEHCFDCHRDEDASSGVRLDYRAKLLGETDGIRLVEPGNSESSKLIRLVAGLDPEVRMPPDGEGAPLSPEMIAILRAWVDQGVAWDDEVLPNPFKQQTDHWSFQRVRRPAIPEVQSQPWSRNPIDRFVLGRLEAANIAPSAMADRSTLIRRLSLNLLGLPPTQSQVRRFLSDPSPQAYEQLVERLLASPHYGERWGRHWLDVARFAESCGYVENHDWPHMFRYRDWVVGSFNGDKPFDTFVTQQLAGDELTPYQDENIIATGFLATARLATEELSCVRQENDMYVDIVNAMSSAFLGLTTGCAQCHDHKFDPITQRDYYGLQAFFVNGYPGNLVLRESNVTQEYHDTADELRRHTLAIRERILEKAFDEPDQADVADVMRKATDERSPEDESTYRITRASLNIRLAGCNGYRITGEEKKRTEALTATLNKQADNVRQTWGFYSPATSPHEVTVLPMKANFPLIHDPGELGRRKGYLLRRGDPYSTAFSLLPDWPEVLRLPHADPSGTDALSTNRRTHLAAWITSPHNPLTARVWVNRIWHYHFGRGLVATPGNFGVRGAPPTNQRLLDFLASELVDSGWSTKHIQRLIVTSSVYRQSAAFNQVSARVDPENRLYWRWPSRRLEAESLRDVALFVGGKIDNQIGGPSVPVGQTSRRRSLYHFQKRDVPSDLQSLFDGPTAMSASCDQRHVSTTALQSLYMLNSPRAEQFAEMFAERLREQCGDDDSATVESAFQVALGRDPTDDERSRSLSFIGSERGFEAGKDDSLPGNDDAIQAWQDQLGAGNVIADHATQPAVHRQPRYRDAAHGINGRPAVHFAGGPIGSLDHVLEIEHSPEVDLKSGYTIFVVLRFLGEGIANQVVLLKGRRGGMDIGTFGIMRYHNGDAKGHVGIDQNIAGAWSRRVYSQKAIPDNTPLLMIAHWDGKEISLEFHDADGLFCRDDAPLEGTIDTAGMGRLGIGGYRDAFNPNGERFHGDIGELLVFRTPLNTDQMASMTRSLKNKWFRETSSDIIGLSVVGDASANLGVHLSAHAGVVSGGTVATPLGRFCQVLLNLNEFVYVP